MDNNYHDIRELVVQYVLPAFAGRVTITHQKTGQIIERCRLLHAVKYQKLESPGPADEGCLFFSLRAMAHAYSYDDNHKRKQGTMIWNKCQFILYTGCLLDHEPRTDYIELLESGDVLCIPYPDLLDLMRRYEDIKNTIELLMIKQATYYFKQYLLLIQPPLERVKQFRAENWRFLRCSSQEIQAMHLNMSLRSYINCLKKLR